jgi:hypothetical protein
VDSVSDFGVLLSSFNFRDDPWISLPFQMSITHSSSDSLASQRCKWCRERIGFSQAVYQQMLFHVPDVRTTKLTSDLPPNFLRWCSCALLVMDIQFFRCLPTQPLYGLSLATSLLWNLNTSLTISPTTHCLSRLLLSLHKSLKLKANTL